MLKTVNTGGGFMADVITVANGVVVVVNDEYVAGYASEADFLDGDEAELFGEMVDANSTLECLRQFRDELVAEMPDGDDARNWDRWDDLAMIDEAITAAIFNQYFEGVGAADICTTGQSADLATAMRAIVGDVDGVNWSALAARRIALDSEG